MKNILFFSFLFLIVFNCIAQEKTLISEENNSSNVVNVPREMKPSNSTMVGKVVYEPVGNNWKKTGDSKIDYTNAEDCQGDACGVISFIVNPNGKISIKNTSGQAVKVGVQWYFSKCQDIAYWTLSGGQTMDFPWFSKCLPYTANYTK